ncbi:MAG: hypothetical protein A2309_07395 [Bacteroidetes bacterium RIFOXYB2_FULL_35_7]|nr:MAG: hypothetical protein A2309_07395 [Bacteroidetes bacterium RIFOXYB2_FULL_35_7]
MSANIIQFYQFNNSLLQDVPLKDVPLHDIVAQAYCRSKMWNILTTINVTFIKENRKKIC